MFQQGWLDQVRWKAVAFGVILAVSLQVMVTLLVVIPLGLSFDWTLVALIELCVAAGALVAAWRAADAAVLNGIVTGVVCAAISLITSAARGPDALNVWSILFLFGTFAVMGIISGLAAAHLPTRQAAPEFQRTVVRRVGR